MFTITFRFVIALKAPLATLLWNAMPHGVSYFIKLYKCFFHIKCFTGLNNYINGFVTADVYQEPCSPSPCGPNSQCRSINNQAVCSCLPTFIGSPPSCRPECTISAECPLNEACNNHKCLNPCIGTCGYGARCEVVNHNPICSCPAQYTGDPFTHCSQIGKT